MELSSVVFYQGVKLWDNNLYNTVLKGKNKQLNGIEIELRDHLLFLTCPDYEKVIIIGTANMRQAEFNQLPLISDVDTCDPKEKPAPMPMVGPVIFDTQEYVSKPAQRLVVEKPTKNKK